MKAVENIRSVDGGQGELLKRVFDNFRVEVQAKLDEMRAMADDGAALGSAAHAIKSMALNLGAKALSEYCREREVDWKNQLISDAPREIEVMQGHFRDAVRAFEHLLEVRPESA